MFDLLAVYTFWISSSIVVYCYSVYPFILFVMDRIAPAKQPVLASEFPPITIIIAAYNEESVIKSRIENILQLDYESDIEIIIASDGSDDKTADIVRTFENANIKLLEFKKRRGKVNVLNDAVPQAKHEIIVFSDANTHFEPNALKLLNRHFQRNDVGCVVGRLKFVNAEGSKTADLEGVYWKFETFLKKSEGSRGALLGANGAIYAIRKKLFVKCPSNTIVEDFVLPMLILQKGFKVVYEAQAIALEETAKHIIQEKKRRIRIGAGDYQALTMLTDMLHPSLGFSSFAFWSHKVLRWMVPFALILAFGSNFIIRHEGHYFIFYVIQCGFYTAAVVGQMLSWGNVNVKPLSLCYYFVSMNLALLLGFMRFLTNRQKVAWERTER